MFFFFSANLTFQASKHISTIEKLWKMQPILTQTNNKNICQNMHAKSQEGSLTEKVEQIQRRTKGISLHDSKKFFQIY